MNQPVISPRFLDTIPREFSREHLVIGEGTDDTIVRLLHGEKTDPLVLHNVRVALGGAMIPLCGLGSEHVARLIDEAYASGERAGTAMPSGRADREGVPIIELSDGLRAMAGAEDLDEDLKRLVPKTPRP